jgi:hypothetical protein
VDIALVALIALAVGVSLSSPAKRVRGTVRRTVEGADTNRHSRKEKRRRGRLPGRHFLALAGLLLRKDDAADDCNAQIDRDSRL